MKEAMQKTRDIFFQERKKINFNFNSYNKLVRPDWMRARDNRLEATYRDQKILFKEGRIVLAKIAQANSLLFQPGEHDHPAAILYSSEEFFEDKPGKLFDIASLIFSIKGAHCDDNELQMFSDIMADENVALFHIKIPKSITYEKEVYYTTIMVSRKHLPDGYLNFDFFPVLICPEKTEAAIILPSKYWSSELLQKSSLNSLTESN